MEHLTSRHHQHRWGAADRRRYSGVNEKVSAAETLHGIINGGKSTRDETFVTAAVSDAALQTKRVLTAHPDGTLVWAD